MSSLVLIKSREIKT